MTQVEINELEENYLTDHQTILHSLLFDFWSDPLIGIFLDPVEEEFYLTFAVTRESLISFITWLKLSNTFSIDMPIDCFATDSIKELFRFTISYLLQSSSQNFSVKVITKAYQTKPVLSTQSLYPAMNWAEREMWDMSGVTSLKHPDLRRILTDYGFVGHPLHKDFPLSGFFESSYNNFISKVNYETLELAQSSRSSTLIEPTVWVRNENLNAKAF
jgi:NADH:ubiquinone oxidoreductase subunit C